MYTCNVTIVKTFSIFSLNSFDQLIYKNNGNEIIKKLFKQKINFNQVEETLQYGR